MKIGNKEIVHTVKDDFNTIVDYSQFPYKVLVAGFTNLGEDLNQINMIALEVFGYNHGKCPICSEWNELGRCPDTSIGDHYTVEEEYLKYHDDFFCYYTKDGTLMQTGYEIGGPFSQIYGAAHSHTGNYAIKYLGKTGYDYGEEIYYFKENEAAQLFCLLINHYKPTYLGEKPYEFTKNNITKIY